MSLTLREAVGFRLGEPLARLAIGDVLFDQGDLEGAEAYYRAGLEQGQALKLDAAALFGLLSLGDVHQARQQTAEARACFEQALALAQRLGIQRAIRGAQERLKS